MPRLREAAKEEVATKGVVDKSEHTRQVFLKNLPRDMTKDILKTFVEDTCPRAARRRCEGRAVCRVESARFLSTHP